MSPSSHPTALSARRSTTILRRVWAMCVVLSIVVLTTLVFSVSPAVAGPLEDSLAALEAQESKTRPLLDERAALERRYEAQTAEIETLKSKGGIVNDYELQDALRDARGMAEELNELAQRIRSQQDTEDRHRQEVVAHYDILIANLEQTLLTASSEQQLAIVQNLEALQSVREEFRRALQVASNPLEPIDVPDLGEFESIDPEEIAAAADELADNQEKLHVQLTELDERIDSLERRRRLVAFAEDSADEANLFGEEARSTQVQGSRSASTNRASDASKTEESADIQTSGAEAEVTSSGPTNDGAPAAAPPSPGTDDDASDPDNNSFMADGDGAPGDVREPHRRDPRRSARRRRRRLRLRPRRQCRRARRCDVGYRRHSQRRRSQRSRRLGCFGGKQESRW